MKRPDIEAIRQKIVATRKGLHDWGDDQDRAYPVELLDTATALCDALEAAEKQRDEALSWLRDTIYNHEVGHNPSVGRIKRFLAEFEKGEADAKA